MYELVLKDELEIFMTDKKLKSDSKKLKSEKLRSDTGFMFVLNAFPTHLSEKKSKKR